jgi:hypothetical protein
MSRQCCPRVQTVALLLHVITIIRIASGLCCPDVQTVVILLHILPYHGLHPDGVALSFGPMQLSDVNPVKNNETQQQKGTQDRSMNRFEWKTSTRCL